MFTRFSLFHKSGRFFNASYSSLVVEYRLHSRFFVYAVLLIPVSLSIPATDDVTMSSIFIPLLTDSIAIFPTVITSDLSCDGMFSSFIIRSMLFFCPLSASLNLAASAPEKRTSSVFLSYTPFPFLNSNLIPSFSLFFFTATWLNSLNVFIASSTISAVLFRSKLLYFISFLSSIFLISASFSMLSSRLCMRPSVSKADASLSIKNE